MNEQTITVTVAKDLEDLIPTFMTNRQKELEALRSALGAGDMGQLGQLGHRMKGVGNSYGFELISVLGKQLERTAPKPRILRASKRASRSTPIISCA